MTRVLLHVRRSDVVLIFLVCAIAFLVMQSAYRLSRQVSYSMDAPDSVLPWRRIHPIEHFPDTRDFFRWTDGSTLIRLPNPGGIASVTLVAGGGDAGVVPIILGTDAPSLRFTTMPEIRSYHVVLPASDRGRIVLGLVSSTIIANNREIGVMLTNVAIQGGGRAPMDTVLCVVFAVALLYTALRRLYGYRVVAVIGALLPVITLHAWLANGWQYALLGPCLALVGSVGILSLVLCHQGLHARSYVAAGVGLLCATSIIFSPLYVGIPEYRDAVFAEDRLIEYLTALCFLVSVCVSLYGIGAFGRQHWKIYSAIAFVGAIGFLDEISFGERLFTWNMPTMNRIKLDGVHDLLLIMYKTLETRSPGQMLWVALLFAGIAAVGVYVFWKLLQELIVNRMHLVVIFGTVFCFFIVLAVTIDLEIVHRCGTGHTD